MGSLEVKNSLLSKKLKRSETRILIIDDNQIRYNEIIQIFQNNEHLVQATLLDDLKTFEKMLKTSWDLIFFGQAYDIQIEQAALLIQSSQNSQIPILLLAPLDYEYQQYMSYIHKGIYEVLNISYTERFYISTLRALSFSRAIQTQNNLIHDLKHAQLQKREQLVEQNKAVAILQEGIHSQANTEYLNLFGLTDEEALIGLPLLDLLQPQNLNEFKTRFKKVMQGQFELARFELVTQNPALQEVNPLKIEFLPSDEDGGIQISIETVQFQPSHIDLNRAVTLSENTVSAQIQRFLQNQPAKVNALLVFSLAHCPDELLSQDWQTVQNYFSQLATFIQQQAQNQVFKIETTLYATIIQAESLEILNSRLTGLSALAKPQFIRIAQHNYPQQLKMGYSILDSEQFTQTQFDTFLENAYNTALPQYQIAAEFEFSTSLEPLSLEPLPQADQHTELSDVVENSVQTETVTATANASMHIATLEPQEKPVSASSDLIQHIHKALDQATIQLKFQQMYDKHDTDIHIYEVSSSFIHQQEMKSLMDLNELEQDAELAVKVDRWILVEACKQLHNFILQYPEAKLIVNLSAISLFQDTQLPALISKLLTIVGSKIEAPLILQFDEQALAKNLVEAKKAVQNLRAHGAEISVRNFGSTVSSDALIMHSDLTYFSFNENITPWLNDEQKLQNLQAQINRYLEIRPLQFSLKGLNDMGIFANAWNVETRFLQGDYFQKKLDHLTDVQDQ